MAGKKLPERKKGRPATISAETRAAVLSDLAKDGDEKMTYEQIAEANGVSIGTVGNIYAEEKSV